MKGYWIDKESGRVEATYADLSGIVDKNESRDPYGVPTGSVPRAPLCEHRLSPWHSDECARKALNAAAPTPEVRNMANLAAMFPNGAPPNLAQVGGEHYKKMKVQVWDFVIANEIPYMEATCIKYLCRWRDKGGLEDLKKARHFLDKLIEVSS